MKFLSIQDSRNITNSNTFCDVCAQARQHKLPFTKSQIHTTTLFELVHVDTWGPYNTPTHEGYKYFFTIVDDFSRATWTFLLTTRRDTSYALKKFYSND